MKRRTRRWWNVLKREREKGPQNYLYIRKPFEIEKDTHTALAVSVKSPTGLLILIGKRSANECLCMERLWGTIKDPSKHSRQAQSLPLPPPGKLKPRTTSHYVMVRARSGQRASLLIPYIQGSTCII